MVISMGANIAGGFAKAANRQEAAAMIGVAVLVAPLACCGLVPALSSLVPAFSLLAALFFVIPLARWVKHIAMATPDSPSPVLFAVVVVGRKSDGWVVAAAEGKVTIPVSLPTWPASSPEADTMEVSAVEPPSPVLVAVVVVRNHTNDSLVVGASVVELMIHVVDPASQTPVILGGTDVGHERIVEAILTTVVMP